MDIKLVEGIELDAAVVGVYDLIVEVGGECLRVEIFLAGGLSQLSRTP